MKRFVSFVFPALGVDLTVTLPFVLVVFARPRMRAAGLYRAGRPTKPADAVFAHAGNDPWREEVK